LRASRRTRRTLFRPRASRRPFGPPQHEGDPSPALPHIRLRPKASFGGTRAGGRLVNANADMRFRSRGAMRPSFADVSRLEIRGRRESRVHAAPAVSRAKLCKNAHEHTGSAEAIRPSLRNGFTTYFALSLVTGFVATIAARMSACRAVRADIAFQRNLTPASGCQDHTTSPSASRAVRQRRIRVHRIPSRVCDDRERPSGGTGWGGMYW
jgi:hypothetical protein